MLLKRGNIYYFRWQIPVDLREVVGKREIVKSLYTQDKLLAEIRALPYLIMVHRFKNRRIRCPMDKLSPEEQERFDTAEAGFKARYDDPNLIPLTDENIDEAITALWSLAEHRINKEVSRGAKDFQSLSLKREELIRSAEIYKEAVITDKKFLDSPLDDSLSSFGGECVESLIEAGYSIFPKGSIPEKIIQEYVKVEGYISVSVVNELETLEKEAFSPPLHIKGKAGVVATSGPLFSEVHKSFLKFKVKEGLSDKMRKSYERYYADWLELMLDKRISEYEKKDIKNHIRILLKLPKRNLKSYKGRPISVLMGMTDIPEEDIVLPKTPKEARKWIQGVFRYAVDEGWLLISPAIGLNLKLKEAESYSGFETNEVRVMLDAALSCSKPWMKWVIWIAAYSGMRRGEIAQLRASDVCLDKTSGRYYFSITGKGKEQSVKTEAGKRIVPVHPALIKQGMMELVKESEDKLFPNLKSGRVTRWFSGEFRPKCDISKLNEYGSRKVFHSFRHTIVTRAQGAGIGLAKIQQVVGHEKQNTGITGRYTHKLPVSDLIEVIDCLEY